MCFSLILTIHTQVFAIDLNLPNTSINPDKYLFYSIKRLFEKSIIFTKFSKDSKVSYYKDLMQTRLAELNYVVENKLLSEIQFSSQRFSY